MNDRLYLLKIRLLGIEPEIWRRFVVPGLITLDRLHDVIQIVMGWEDYHLHAFTIGKKRYTEFPESEKLDGAQDGRFRLVDLIKQKGRTFGYEYDFGDCWEHEITIEDNRYFNPELETTVACIEGERACPPEDVGGVSGYYEYYRGLIDPDHEEHNSYKTWYGGSAWDGVFEGETYDIGKVNNELLSYLRWSRERLKPWNSTGK